MDERLAHRMPSAGDLDRLAYLLRNRKFAVLTGAGSSTESGIPDYRGPTAPSRKRAPLQYREFMRSAEARRRYWARATIGWARFRAPRPNDVHKGLAALERAEVIPGVITQNVDRLHDLAGSRHVIELHGALAEVVCTRCGGLEPRESVHERILDLNPGWDERGAKLLPDGDAELSDEVVQEFRVPCCVRCRGPLKPHVVFFGENVPKSRVDAAFSMLDGSEALLVVGSSLAVFSGFRFVLRAHQQHKPVVLVNLGEPRRGLDRIDLHVDARAGAVVAGLVQRLVPDLVRSHELFVAR